ncbi:MAG: glycoside hydrolase family 140 protein [Massilibacteroides sp.]|nr:glycoside hydrolase family 140 protein [Massilibacteroides sp.]
MRTILIALIIGICTLPLSGQNTPLLKISKDHHYIVTEDNKPFFWLGGTAWELIHRLNKNETKSYLSDRANKGFTVIQTVILAELDGLNTPNAYGQLPLIDEDPTQLNKNYFESIDYLIQQADSLGLYIGLLPTWGDKWNKLWGVGPEIFNPQNAEKYGELLAKRYQAYTNIIWILGGDRKPEKAIHSAIINAMAKGIRTIDQKHLITYHPVGAKIATEFFDQKWLDIDMFQSGHSRIVKEYDYVLKSRKNSTVRPVINGESRYENIPDRFWEDLDKDWLDDSDVRVSAYWSMISGAAGYTYGCNDIWQMYDYTRTPVISARTDWKESLHLPGSTQMSFMKNLFELFPWQEMVYNQSIILNDNPQDETYRVCAVGPYKKFVIAYTPYGKPIEVDLTQLHAERVNAYWYNPRSGKVTKIGDYSTQKPIAFKPWSKGRGSDFILVIMDINSTYKLTTLNN